ncbi:T9SS type A sorting domain-containing protein [Flavobacterium sp. JP2137]|uniref:T9SS type A sorting domain-containing protein n=1 Tax=Flavobacterium sp. JP2137 TaxID=3414510 RepID=UPI003D300586
MKTKLLSKTTLLVLITAISCSSMKAQSYQVTRYEEPYVPLENAEELNVVVRQYYNDFRIPLPFSVYFFDREVDQLWFTNGDLFAIAKDDEFLGFRLSAQTAYLIDAGYVEGGGAPIMGSPTQSPFKYKVEGQQGNRILKFETNNAASTEELDFLNSNLMRINYQIWLYEAKRSLTIRFGENSMTNFDLFFNQAEFGEPLAPYYTVGFNRFVGELDEDLGRIFWNIVHHEHLSGSENSPFMVEDDYQEVAGLNAYPKKGVVFEFGPNLKAAQFDKQAYGYYPNPTTGLLWLIQPKQSGVLSEVPYEIYNALGQRVLLGTVEFQKPMDLTPLTNGVYFIRIPGQSIQQIIKN